VGLDGAFATYLGWLLPWGSPVTLLGETCEQVSAAQRELVRIGIDRPAARATGEPDDWSDRPLTSFGSATFADLAAARLDRSLQVVDVRREEEHAVARIEGAVNIPVHEVPDRMGELPDTELWVHCASGYRASVAASLLHAAGRRPVAVDDEFANAAEAGLPVVTR
jgi:rhodanese-related sulfurtransferase